MKKRFLGIDIGTYNIKLINITIDGTSVSIDSPQLMRTPEPLVQNGHLTEADELTEILKKSISKMTVPSRKALVIINDSLVVTRDIMLPEATSREIDRMIRMEASEYLPNDISEYTLSHRVLVPSDKNKEKSNYVLMSSIKTELAKEFYYAIKHAGLIPVAIDITINSMLKYLKNLNLTKSMESTGDAIAMIDFGASSSKIVVSDGKKPVFQKVILNNPRKIDVMLATLLNMDRSVAEEKKIKFGLSYLYGADEDNEANTVGPVIENQVNLLISEVYKHLHAFTDRNGITLSRLILTGGLAMMKGLREYAEAAFSIPCSVISPGKEIIDAMKENLTIGSDEVLNIYPYFSNLIGAAFRED